MNKTIEQAKEQVISYYKDFIEMCLEVHGIDLHTIISDCITAGYNCAQRPASTKDELIVKIKQGQHHQFIYNQGKQNVTCRCGLEAIWLRNGYLCPSITAYPCEFNKQSEEDESKNKESI